MHDGGHKPTGHFSSNIFSTKMPSSRMRPRRWRFLDAAESCAELLCRIGGSAGQLHVKGTADATAWVAALRACPEHISGEMSRHSLTC